MSLYEYIPLILLIGIITYAFTKKPYQTNIDPKQSIKYRPITPQNTVLTFDLHDVIVNYDYLNIIKTFFNSPHKLKLIIAMLNPFVWKDIFKLKWQNAVAEQYIIGLGEKYPSLKPYIPLGIRLANCQRPNPAMISLIKKLKTKGYTIHLFSNIGAEIFEHFKAKFPEIITLFDAISIPSRQNGYLKKPYHNAFINFLETYKNDNRQIIFVDDKIRNIRKAASYGIIGIHFKNSCQLTKELENLGLT